MAALNEASTDGRKKEEVFKHLFDTYFVPLCQYMHTWWDNEQEIEDEVMDLFVTLWNDDEKFRSILSVKAYLFRSAHNRCVRLLRDRPDLVPLDAVAETEDFGTGGETPLENEELNRLIERAILSLPPYSREIFLKNREGGQTYREIAEEMGISVKTVEKHIARCLQSIRKTLGDSCFFLFFL